MKIRIMGTSEEVKQLAELLPAIMKVSSVSGEYPNRGSSDVRVYVDGSIEIDSFTQTMQKYAEVKEQIGAITIIASTPKGAIFEALAGISAKAYLVMMNFLVSEKFNESLAENLKNFAKDSGLDFEKIKDWHFKEESEGEEK